MKRGRLLSDHRGQPSPRRAESYISARRPATPAGGRCSKYRPEAVFPANGRLEARTAFYVRKECGAAETRPASAARRCGSTPSAQGRTDGRPPGSLPLPGECLEQGDLLGPALLVGRFEDERHVVEPRVAG